MHQIGWTKRSSTRSSPSIQVGRSRRRWERADEVVDFSGFEGRPLVLTNNAEASYSDPHPPEVLQVRVLETGAEDSSLPVDELDGLLMEIRNTTTPTCVRPHQ